MGGAMTWYPIVDDQETPTDAEYQALEAIAKMMGEYAGNVSMIGRDANERLLTGISAVRRPTETIALIVRDDGTIIWLADTPSPD